MIKRPRGATRDDELHIVSHPMPRPIGILLTFRENTQSGSQWDGMRHFGVANHDVFYNKLSTHVRDRREVDVWQHAQRHHSWRRHTHSRPKEHRSQPLQNRDSKYVFTFTYSLTALTQIDWASHGICGRGVLLDLVRFYTADGKPLPYDPWTSHPISVKELQACAKKQGVQFRVGDVLILRVGFMSKFYEESQEGRDALGEKPETLSVFLLYFKGVWLTGVKRGY